MRDHNTHTRENIARHVKRFALIKCPVCGKKLRHFIPKGGDGSAVRVYAHKYSGVHCHGSLIDVTPDTYFGRG